MSKFKELRLVGSKVNYDYAPNIDHEDFGDRFSEYSEVECDHYDDGRLPYLEDHTYGMNMFDAKFIANNGEERNYVFGACEIADGNMQSGDHNEFVNTNFTTISSEDCDDSSNGYSPSLFIVIIDVESKNRFYYLY